jgi:hypothetical protein
MVISSKKTKQTDTVTGVSGDVEVSDLLSLIPQEYIDTLAKDLKVDMWVKKLKADTLFKLVLFSLLNSERLSLRVMEEACNDPLFHLLAPALGSDTVTWVAIRERLMKVDSAFFMTKSVSYTVKKHLMVIIFVDMILRWLLNLRTCCLV